MIKRIVPFKTPLDYFKEALQENPSNINCFPEIQKTLGWERYDCDLHIYPYVNARSAILSMGCKGRCAFCPTAKYFKGKVYYGDPEKILVHYKGQNVHFMDEDFFQNDIRAILPILKRLKIKWLGMTTNANLARVLGDLGEKILFDSGCKCLEIGLENVALCMKVKTEVKSSLIALYYLNLTCLPGETKETIKQTAKWMQERSLENAIHFNNGLWFAPGQFFYPYEEERTDGRWTNSEFARTRPTFLPFSLLVQDYVIKNLEQVNYFSQLVFGVKLFPKKKSGNIGQFIKKDWQKAFWLLVGLRSGGIE